MTILLKQIFSLVKLLNSETGTTAIAAGFCCGLVLGFSPMFSLQGFLIILVIFFFRVQAGAAFLAAFFFAFVAYLLDPVFHQVGSAVLEAESLKPLYTTLYNMPVIPFTRFNNSVIMGAGVVAIALTPVAYPLFVKLIHKYRETVTQRFRNSKLWKLMQATSLYKWYTKYEQLFG